MKRALVLAPLGAAALLLASTAASAQSVRFSDIDRDGNGRLSYQELERAFGRAGADRVWSRNGASDLTRQDANRIYSDRDDDDDDDDDDDGRRGGLNDDDDDDDDGRGRGFGGDDDDDDRGSGGRDDDDDDGGSSGGGGDDDDDDGGDDDDD